MSVINKMLQDLEQRRPSKADSYLSQAFDVASMQNESATRDWKKIAWLFIVIVLLIASVVLGYDIYQKKYTKQLPISELQKKRDSEIPFYLEKVSLKDADIKKELLKTVLVLFFDSMPKYEVRDEQSSTEKEIVFLNTNSDVNQFFDFDTTGTYIKRAEFSAKEANLHLRFDLPGSVKLTTESGWEQEYYFVRIEFAPIQSASNKQFISTHKDGTLDRDKVVEATHIDSMSVDAWEEKIKQSAEEALKAKQEAIKANAKLEMLKKNIKYAREKLELTQERVLQMKQDAKKKEERLLSIKRKRIDAERKKKELESVVMEAQLELQSQVKAEQLVQQELSQLEKNKQKLLKEQAEAQSNLLLAENDAHEARVRLLKITSDAKEKLRYAKKAKDLADTAKNSGEDDLEANPSLNEISSKLGYSQTRSQEMPVQSVSEVVDSQDTKKIQKKRLSEEDKAKEAFQNGLRLYQRGLVSQAVASLLQSIQLKPDEYETRKSLISIYIRQNDFKKALGLIDDTATFFPDEIELTKLKAHIQLKLGQPKKALATLKAYEHQNEIEPEIYALMAAIHQQLGEHAFADKLYSELLQHEPNNAAWLMGKGIALDNLKQLDNARAYYERALKNGDLNQASKSYLEQRIYSISANGIRKSS